MSPRRAAECAGGGSELARPLPAPSEPAAAPPVPEEDVRGEDARGVGAAGAGAGALRSRRSQTCACAATRASAGVSGRVPAGAACIW